MEELFSSAGAIDVQLLTRGKIRNSSTVSGNIKWVQYPIITDYLVMWIFASIFFVIPFGTITVSFLKCG